MSHDDGPDPPTPQGEDAALFAFLDDLEQQAEALYATERVPELADRSRAEYQQVTLAGRLMASVGHDVTLGVTGVGPVTGRLERVSASWCRVSGSTTEWIVAVTHIDTVVGASARAIPEIAWSPLTKLGLGSVLRGLAEAGERCVIHGVDGSIRDGVVRRVGQDFLELEEVPGRVVLIAFNGLAAIQSEQH
ncbi:hypothetical protein GCM10027020_02760 [Nocardioides salsibiostraticola]